MSLRRSIPAFFLIFVFAFTLFLISRRQTRQADHQAWSDPTSTFALKSSLAGIPPTSAFNTPYWSPDGHLYFLDNQPSSASILSRLSTPPAQHPIFLLIRNATISWQAKLSQQSPDLLSAAAEYYRRHKRHPPRDFDRWWRWASDHKVKLLDEYDSMYRALEPFFALPPSVFRERVNDLLNGRTKWKDVSYQSYFDIPFPNAFKRDRSPLIFFFFGETEKWDFLFLTLGSLHHIHQIRQSQCLWLSGS